MIKLLIVDDSALMRRQLGLLLESEGTFEIRFARNGLEAVAENRSFMPDVVTLDINMPEMDGITALSLIMAERAVPVIMVSSLTEKGALSTFEALNLGAVDYVAKPGGTISLSLNLIRYDLLSKVRGALKARNLKRSPPTPISKSLAERLPEQRVNASATRWTRLGIGGEGLVLVGVSTGGPTALEQLLPRLPVDFPWPVLVAQHMPSSFTGPFAARLNTACELEVVEAARPMAVVPGKVYIGKGGADMILVRRSGQLTVLPKPESKEHLWHPSVELLGRSALEHVPATHLLGVMLTGMGHDGADAFTQIKRDGGRTIAESEDSAVVFGMPAELIERGGASVVLPLDKIATQVKAWAGR